MGLIFKNQWHLFRPDQTMNKKMIYSEEAGYVKMGLHITKVKIPVRPGEKFIDKSKFGERLERCRLVVDLICA